MTYETPKQESQVDPNTTIMMAFINKGVIDEVGAFPLPEAVKYVVKPTEHFGHLTVDTTLRDVDNN